MKKLVILLTTLLLANTAFAAPQRIPTEFHGTWQSADKALTVTMSAKGLGTTAISPEPADNCQKRHQIKQISGKNLRQDIRASMEMGISDAPSLSSILATLKDTAHWRVLIADYPCADGGSERFIRLDKQRALYILSAPEDLFIPLYRK